MNSPYCRSSCPGDGGDSPGRRGASGRAVARPGPGSDLRETVSIGKRSRMMHIVNGDFQALVVTDEIAGNRHLFC